VFSIHSGLRPPLFFANAENFRRRAVAALEVAEQPVRWFILNMGADHIFPTLPTAVAAYEQWRDAQPHG
jgi:MFS superfamily sulfate permease-like transporter